HRRPVRPACGVGLRCAHPRPEEVRNGARSHRGDGQGHRSGARPAVRGLTLLGRVTSATGVSALRGTVFAPPHSDNEICRSERAKSIARAKGACDRCDEAPHRRLRLALNPLIDCPTTSARAAVRGGRALKFLIADHLILMEMFVALTAEQKK